MLVLNDYDKKVYETELKSFLPNEFIDCHVHAWKDEFPRYGSSNGGSTWVRKLSQELLVEELEDVYNQLFPGLYEQHSEPELYLCLGKSGKLKTIYRLYKHDSLQFPL